MATADAGEPEYESDPDELKQSLATRRREASDEDDDDDDNGEEVTNQRGGIDSDQFDEQVGTVKYGNDEDKSEDGEDSYEDEEEEEEGGEYREHVIENDNRSNMVKEAEDAAEEEKEKKQSTVPTGGAFYMHDDRYQEISAGRSRGMRGGRKPWGSGDERKWGHDKFEEMNTQEKHYDVELLSMVLKLF